MIYTWESLVTSSMYLLFLLGWSKYIIHCIRRFSFVFRLGYLGLQSLDVVVLFSLVMRYFWIVVQPSFYLISLTFVIIIKICILNNQNFGILFFFVCFSVLGGRFYWYCNVWLTLIHGCSLASSNDILLSKSFSSSF